MSQSRVLYPESLIPFLSDIPSISHFESRFIPDEVSEISAEVPFDEDEDESSQTEQIVGIPKGAAVLRRRPSSYYAISGDESSAESSDWERSDYSSEESSSYETSEEEDTMGSTSLTKFAKELKLVRYE